MEECIYIEILVEDKSGSILVEHIMDKYVADKKNVTYGIHGFKGLGKIPLNVNRLSQVKSKRLLTDLPGYLKGIDASLKNMPGKKAVFVILDSDNENCSELKHSLVQMYQTLEIQVEVIFCIALEETEAWLLGDSEALLKAYPMAKRSLMQKYVQDSVVGTWECLADIVYKGGLKALKKSAVSYYEIGAFKIECAENIGKWLDIRKNSSQSFQYLIRKLDVFYENSI